MTATMLKCERIGQRHQRFPDLPAGFDVRRVGEDDEPIAFGYRVTREDCRLPYGHSASGIRFVYIPDPSYDFIATPADLNRHSPKAKRLTWSEGCFVLARFFEGWFSVLP